MFYLALNSHLPELSDRRVRRALRLSVDRDALIKQLFPGQAKPAFSIIPEGIQGYTTDPSLVITDQQSALAEAQRLMREAGYGPDNRLALTLSSNYNEQYQNIGEFVKYNWSEIYVDLTLDMTEKDFKTWFWRFTAGDFMIGRRSWNAGNARMDGFMDACKPLADPRCGHYDEAAYEDILAKAYAEEDLDRRRNLFREADRMISEADVLVPLFHGIVPVALSERIDISDNVGEIRRIRSYELKPIN